MSWFDRMYDRVLAAKDAKEARLVMEDYIDPNTGTTRTNDEDGTHIHIHGPGGAGGMKGTDELDVPNDNPADPAGGDNTLADLSARIAALEEVVQQLMGNEEEPVDLEDPETKDRRSFVMRRGSKIKARDQETEIPVPERNPEMIGKTDLPALEDLDARMAGRSESSGSSGYAAADRRRRFADSADMEDTWQDMIASAEILVPGIRVPTFDAKLTAIRTAQRMCSHRRVVMDRAMANEATREVIERVIGIKDAAGFKPLSCDALKMAYIAAANAVREENNQNNAGRHSVADAAARRSKDNGGEEVAGPPSITVMNQQNREFWAKQGRGNGAGR